MAATDSISQPELKQCSACKQFKALDCFSRNGRYLRSQCKSCSYERNKQTAKAYQQHKAANRKPLKRCGRYRRLPTLSETDKQRFHASIQKGEPSECWTWQGHIHPEGYGLFSLDGVKWLAHRIAYYLATGDDPGEMLIRHEVCENPPCCNPAHLKPGSEKENAEDAVRHGRVQSGDQHHTARNPGRMPRGDQHWSRRYPERVARGEQSGPYQRMLKRG